MASSPDVVFSIGESNTLKVRSDGTAMVQFDFSLSGTVYVPDKPVLEDMQTVLRTIIQREQVWNNDNNINLNADTTADNLIGEIGWDDLILEALGDQTVVKQVDDTKVNSDQNNRILNYNTETNINYLEQQRALIDPEVMDKSFGNIFNKIVSSSTVTSSTTNTSDQQSSLNLLSYYYPQLPQNQLITSAKLLLELDEYGQLCRPCSPIFHDINKNFSGPIRPLQYNFKGKVSMHIDNENKIHCVFFDCQ
jgi:hypothetical protein